MNTKTLVEKANTTNSRHTNAIKFCAYVISDGLSFPEAYKKVFSGTRFILKRKDLPPNSSGYSELIVASSKYSRSPAVVDILTAGNVKVHTLQDLNDQLVKMVNNLQTPYGEHL